MNLLTLGLLGLSLSATAAEPGDGPAADLDNPEVLATFVDAVATTHMKTENSPSGVVSIVRDGKLIFARGYGFQDIDDEIPVDPDRTLFRPGSISKLFTWIAVMQLVERGRIDLDADVNTYLKSFQIRDSWPGRPVTLRHIMTHSAGFEDGGLGYLIIKDIERVIPLAESMRRYQPERVNPPGVQTAYSNYATALAGLIVANVAGLDFNEYVERNIFEPLGMSRSSFREPLPPPLIDGMAASYSYEGGRYRKRDFELISNFGPAGALSATAIDMARFMMALLNGGELEGARILEPETLQQMLTRQFGHDERLSGMGLGFYENELNGVRLLGHGGDTIYFHSNLALDLERKIGFFVSFGGAGGGAVRSTLTEAFAERFYPAPARAAPAATSSSQTPGQYAGQYLFWRANFSTVEKLSSLLSAIPVTVNEDDTLTIGERRYVEVGPDLFEVVGRPDFLNSRVAFQRDAEGEVSGFVFANLPFMSTYRAPAYKTLTFSGSLLAVACLAFAGVLLGRFYQRRMYRQLGAARKKAARVAVVTAALNLLFVAALTVFVINYGSELFSAVPPTIMVVLAIPLLATAAAFYQLYQATLLWWGGHGTLWQRLRYSALTLLGLYMVWFYAYWNLLGFQYHS